MGSIFDDQLPECIAQLIGMCEVGENTFDNDDMSVALKFGELLWRRLSRMAEYYERQSVNFMPNDIRGPMMVKSAKDMRFVMSDSRRDL